MPDPLDCKGAGFRVKLMHGVVEIGNRFAAREFDTETSLCYYRARYYDQSTGRFLSQDPVRFQGGINFYAYVRNNPSNFLDSSGLCRVSVGHHAIFWLISTCGPPIAVEHSYVVIGEGNNRQVLNAAPDGPLCR